jgi:hypothetical protein
MQWGGFAVTILIRLILHIIYISPIFSPSQPLPTILKAIARGFLVLFHTGIWSPSTIYCHFNFLHSPLPLPLVPPPHTHCTYFRVLVFVISIYVTVQRDVSLCAHCGCILLWSIQHLLFGVFKMENMSHPILFTR